MQEKVTKENTPLAWRFSAIPGRKVRVSGPVFRRQHILSADGGIGAIHRADSSGIAARCRRHAKGTREQRASCTQKRKAKTTSNVTSKSTSKSTSKGTSKGTGKAAVSTLQRLVAEQPCR